MTTVGSVVFSSCRVLRILKKEGKRDVSKDYFFLNQIWWFSRREPDSGTTPLSYVCTEPPHGQGGSKGNEAIE
jgi:hypothetical protein